MSAEREPATDADELAPQAGAPRPPEPPGEASFERFFASEGLGAFPPEESEEAASHPEPPEEPAPAPSAAGEQPQAPSEPDMLAALRPAKAKAPSAATRSAIVRFARDQCDVTPWPRQAEILHAIASSSARTIVLRLGRRSGKGLMASILAVYEAIVHADAHLAAVRRGERPVVALIANSAEQARVLAATVRTLLDRPNLRPLVTRDTADRIELSTGLDIVVLPCSARTIRGRAIAVAILDEFAHAIDGEGRLLSPQAASELLDAILPATAQFPAGRVIVASTPRWQAGTFYDLDRLAQSELHPDIVGFHYSTAEVNPTIPASFFRTEALRDPAGFRREYLALFDSGIGALFDDVAVRSAVANRGELLPARGWRYLMSCDPAYSGDRFAVTLGHLDQAGALIVDVARAWQGSRGQPLDHRKLLDEVASIATLYNRARVTTDQYAGQAWVSGLAERGIHATSTAWNNENKLTAAQALRQRLFRGEIELPAHAGLVAELTMLESRPTPGGKLTIAAPPGAHDDLAMSLLGLVALAEANKYSGRPIAIGPDIWA